MSDRFILVKKGRNPQEYGSFVGSLKVAKAKIAEFVDSKEWEVWGVVWPPKKARKDAK